MEPEAKSSEVETLWFSSTSNPTEDSPAILHGNFNSNSFSITTALYGTGTEYGSGYGQKPEYKAPEPEYGYGYGRKPEYEASESEYGSGYSRKPEFEAPPTEFGSGNGRKPSYGEESGYGDKPPRSQAMVRKAIMEKSHREGQAMGGPVMRRQKARRGRVTVKSHR
ncbi:hypothetical protein DVH24_042770 [Malus domestica]|uniref:Uncharacterized protein n=1 Tax=Malus domestica TaxID=3750 RepID=A0A498I4F0_MALDO|nr:hypothetical protein DVH24_042770 [Malus domestica]